MMFRTIVEIEKNQKQIYFKDRIMLMGSCFTENIGDKLEKFCFNVDVNPLGVIYNPLSVANSLQNLIDKKIYLESELFFHNEIWSSFDHHSKYSDKDKQTCIKSINDKLKVSSEFLKDSEYLFLSLGTSFVYEQKENGKLVANCHKLPENNFNRRLLEVEEIVLRYDKLINNLKHYNPKINIVLTISPVRHWKDGADKNNLSKSILKVSFDRIIERHSNVVYFPAFEIMMDDLRDYRFYKDDMLHPNGLAISYMWEKFGECYFDKKTKILLPEIEKLIKASEHRPFNPGSKSYKDFIELHLDKIEELNKKYPEVNTKKLKQRFEDLMPR